MAFQMAMPWHDGEEKMQKLMRSPDMDNPTSSMLTAQGASLLQRAPLIAIGALDSENRPWTTVWGGEPGLSQPLGQSMIGIRTPVDMRHDPVVKFLLGGKVDGETTHEQGQGRMVSGLIIDLMARKRVKLFGRMLAGAVEAVNSERPEINLESSEGQVQLVVRIDQSLGNCPKYINRKEIRHAIPYSKLLSDSPNLSDGALDLISRSDLFFVSSSNSEFDMDTNHRGGPPGFVRARRTISGNCELVWPEYSGNRLYQTLGNLQINPLAGLVFPDFETGNVLYLTGTTEILVGPDAAFIIPRSNLAIKLTVTGARFVEKGLPFQGVSREYSPYNPKVRYLASETPLVVDKKSSPANSATLLEQTAITPTISRFRFTMNNPGKWKAGQWVALDFSEDLDIGYSHMRDDDPQSINDDFIRTFTISSPPAPRDNLADDEFEITIRKVGPVTDFLFRQKASNKLESPIQGFGGDFVIEQSGKEEIVAFIAGGVGITPLLAQIPSLDLQRLNVFWTLSLDDVNLVVDVVDRYPDLGNLIHIYLTGSYPANMLEHTKSAIERIKQAGCLLELRRLQKDDLAPATSCNRWYICTGTGLRKTLLEWLEGKDVVFEDFNF